MAENNTKKTKKVTVPETDREKVIADERFHDGVEVGKFIGSTEVMVEQCKQEMDLKLRSKKIMKEFADSICYAMTGVVLGSIVTAKLMLYLLKK